MNTQPDFEELLRLLEENRVDYMIVGGYAVAFHGYPRFTKDIDIFYDNSPPNLQNLRRALIAFGFGENDVSVESFADKGDIVTFGVVPVRVDLLNDIDGVSFADALTRAVRGTYGRTPVTFISRDDLVRNKLSTARAKDKADVEELG